MLQSFFGLLEIFDLNPRSSAQICNIIFYFVKNNFGLSHFLNAMKVTIVDRFCLTLDKILPVLS